MITLIKFNLWTLQLSILIILNVEEILPYNVMSNINY